MPRLTANHTPTTTILFIHHIGKPATTHVLVMASEECLWSLVICSFFGWQFFGPSRVFLLCLALLARKWIPAISKLKVTESCKNKPTQSKIPVVPLLFASYGCIIICLLLATASQTVS